MMKLRHSVTLFNLSQLTFIVTPMFVLLSQRQTDINFPLSYMIFDTILLTISGFSVLCFLGFISHFTKYNDLYERIILSVTFFVFLSLINPIPLQSNTDMEGMNYSFNFIILVSHIVISIYITYLVRCRVASLNKFLLIITTFISLGLVILNFVQYQKKLNVFDSVRLGEKNIIVFSFDGIPGITINKIFSDTKYDGQLFKDFTVFNNTFSHSPATYASLFSEIYGAINWKLIAETETDLLKLNKELIARENLEFFKHATLYGAYSDYKTESTISLHNYLNVLGSDITYKPFTTVPFVSSSICRIGFCSLGETYGNLTNYVRKLTNIAGYKLVEENRLLDYLAFMKIKDSFVKSEENYGSFFGHFVFSHHPIVHDENCNFGEDDIAQNEHQVIKQSICILKSMKDIILKLKSIGVYDNSLIVFKSDHGKHAGYFDRKTLRGVDVFTDNNKWGYDRYRPFFMMKAPYQVREEMKFHDALVYLSDLRGYYCSYYNELSPWKAAECELKLPDYYKNVGNKIDIEKYLFVPFNAKTHKFDEHDAIKGGSTPDEMEKIFRSWIVK